MMMLRDPDTSESSDDASSSSESDSSSEEEWEAKEEEEESEDEEEEDDEAKVRLGLVGSILSLVPFTKYWWEARRAYEAANNLKRMQNEVARARRLVLMCENGHHEDALAEHAEDTELTDFWHFNAVKYKMIQLGQWQWQKPSQFLRADEQEGRALEKFETTGLIRRIQRDLRSHQEVARPLHLEPNWGRVKAEFRQLCDDQCDEDDPMKPTSRMTEAQKRRFELRERKRKQCGWSAMRNGVLYVCRNPRFPHPTRTTIDAYGAVRKDLLQYCAYHTGICVNDENHDTRIQPVTNPNECGLCNSCYVKAKRRPPRDLNAMAVPGVVPDDSNRPPALRHEYEKRSAAMKKLQDLAVKEALERRDGELTVTTQCTWIANKANPRERGYVCHNLIIVHPVTGELVPYCGWHAPQCLAKHKLTDDDQRILVPNADGLCATHFAARHGRTPVDLGWPLPGMKKLEVPEFEQDHEKLLEAGVLTPHPLAPKKTTTNLRAGIGASKTLLKPAPPPPRKLDRRRSSRRRPEKEESSSEHQHWWWRKRRSLPFMMMSATKKHGIVLRIQRAYRGHAALREARRRLMIIEARKRIVAATTIAATMRASLIRAEARRDLEALLKACRLVQHGAREWLDRRKRSQRQAALRLQRACVSLYRRMLQRAAVELQQRRKEKWKVANAERLMYRFVLGAIGRFRAVQRREERVSEIAMQIRIASLYRGRMGRFRAAIQRAEKRTCNLAAIFVQARIRKWASRVRLRKRLAARHHAVPQLQRYLRGFLCRRRAKHARDLQEWIWQNLVGVDDMQRRKHLERLLPKARYPIRRKKAEDDDPAADVASMESVNGTSWFDEADGEIFEKHDEAKVGTVTKYAFREAVRELWRSKGLEEIGRQELEDLVSLFDQMNDGNVNWRRFLDFALLVTRPCSKHRRLACAQCAARGPCLRKGCTCDCYLRDPMKLRDLVCKRCGHTPFTHMLVPQSCVEDHVFFEDVAPKNNSLGITSAKLDDIFRNRSAVPDAPNRSLGVDLADVLRPRDVVVVANDDAPSRRLPEEEEGRDDAHAKTKKVPSTDVLCLWRAPRKEEKRNWSAEEAGFLKVVTQTIFEPNASIRESIEVAGSEEDAHGSSGLVKTSSKVELERGFGITRPIPVITNDELRLSVQVVNLYLKLLEEFGSVEKGALELDENFVRLIYEHDVFLERHWKKLVKDLRLGKLNRHLPVTMEQRQTIEARLDPKPDEARRVDAALRQLGFHARSAGSYVTKKTQRSQASSKIACDDEIPEEVAKDDLALGAPEKKKEKKRRYSTMDVDESLTEPEVHQLLYDIRTLPHGIPDPVAVAPRDTRRYVCPHPGCGECFSNRRMAEKHLEEVHSRGIRLAIGTPMADQYFRAYWPEDVSWRDEVGPLAKHFNFKCPVCPVAVRTRRELRRHLVIAHRSDVLRDCLHELRAHRLNDRVHADQQNHRRIDDDSSADELSSSSSRRSKVFMGSRDPRVGAHMLGAKKRRRAPRPILISPPFPPPPRAPLVICLRHDKPNFRCPACAQRTNGPMPPLKFYKDVVVSAKTIVDHRQTFLDQTFQVQSERCPLIYDGSKQRHANLLAVCVDHNGTVWIAVAYFWSYHDIKRSSVLPDDFDKRNEVLEDANVVYLPAERIIGPCYTLGITKDDFHARRQSGELPLHSRVKFSRFLYDGSRVGPRRVLDSNVPVDGCTVTVDSEPPSWVVPPSTTGSFRTVGSFCTQTSGHLTSASVLST